MKYINDLVSRLEQKGIAMKPCNNDEILMLQKLAKGFKLPEAYMEFMEKMGGGTAKQYMRGESCYIDEINDLKKGAVELLEENDSILSLAENEYVFWMSQGCMFCFFKIDEGDNPPVYFYNEAGEDKFIKIANKLSEFLVDKLEMNKNLFKSVE